jgi:hypothetical protein
MPSLLPVVVSSIIPLYQPSITRQSILSTKELIGTKLTGNDRAYKIEDNVIDGVHLTVPSLDVVFMHRWWSI